MLTENGMTIRCRECGSSNVLGFYYHDLRCTDCNSRLKYSDSKIITIKKGEQPCQQKKRPQKRPLLRR